MGIKFSVVFCGWDAFQKVQLADWLPIMVFGGVRVNTLFTFADGGASAGGRAPPSPAGKASPAALDRSGISAFTTVTPFLKLCLQMLDDKLANSRLVMAAIREMPVRGSEMWSVKRPVPSNTDQRIGKLCTHRLPGRQAVDVRFC